MSKTYPDEIWLTHDEAWEKAGVDNIYFATTEKMDEKSVCYVRKDLVMKVEK